VENPAAAGKQPSISKYYPFGTSFAVPRYRTMNGRATLPCDDSGDFAKDGDDDDQFGLNFAEGV
jgi:hypothetical protein